MDQGFVVFDSPHYSKVVTWIVKILERDRNPRLDVIIARGEN
jgi:hypothetical protein